mmetsp:Transcript_21209/g.56598  ORF Transcript_21209/g.56598 Transcript_21209/m.56598 type:complete len:131 (-) Transcript_21209:1320-1712(-)
MSCKKPQPTRLRQLRVPVSEQQQKGYKVENHNKPFPLKKDSSPTFLASKPGLLRHREEHRVETPSRVSETEACAKQVVRLSLAHEQGRLCSTCWLTGLDTWPRAQLRELWAMAGRVACGKEEAKLASGAL